MKKWETEALNSFTQEGQYGILSDKPQTDIPFRDIFMGLARREAVGSFEAAQFFDDGEGELRRYDVYKIRVDGQTYVLKKSDEAEAGIYRDFLAGQGFRTPKYFGSGKYDGKIWLLMEYIEGTDLREFTEEMAYGCADSITAVMNAYWQRDEQEFESKKLDRRFEKYWKRINKRAQCLEGEPLLRQAYSVFLQRQLTCPRTLCNGDFLQYNAILRDGEIYIIDWAFAGIMPYSLDIARLIAHGTEDRRTFPFYMVDQYREIYVRQVYEKLREKPDQEQYGRDIKLSLLNEYIEFIEWELNHPDEERDGVFSYYYGQARKAAEEIINF